MAHQGLRDIKKTFLTCLLLLYTTHDVLCTQYCCPLYKNQHIPYHVATVDYAHVRSGIASIKDLVAVAQENPTKQTDVLVSRGSVTGLLDLITVSQEREPNSRTGRGSFVLLTIQHLC